MNDVDIVIPCLNASDLTWRAVQHVMMFAPRRLALRQIIVVDDGCSDATPELGAFLEREAIGQYVRHPRNLGVQAAWNTGLRASRAEFVLFMNSDVAVFPGTIDAMGEVARTRPYVAANQMIGNWNPALILKHAHDARDRRGEIQEGGVFGGCFMMNREFLNELGGFDEAFFLTFGDSDVVERMRDKGHEPCVITGAIAYHGNSMTRRREFGKEKDIALDLADRERFEKKWAHRPDVLERHPRLDLATMDSARQKYWSVSEPIS